MRHGWAYIYDAPPASARFDELVDHFALDTITLAQPGSGRVVRLSPLGDDIESSREDSQDILRECTILEEVNFNLWLAPSNNLFCSICKINDEVVRESYALDGKSEKESVRVIEDLIQLFSRRAMNQVAFGIVADRYAELRRSFHWDDFFVGRKHSPAEWPRRKHSPAEWPLVIGCSKSFPKIEAIPGGLYSRTEPSANSVLFRKTG